MVAAKLTNEDVKTIYKLLEKGHVSKELAHTKYGSDVNFLGKQTIHSEL